MPVHWLRSTWSLSLLLCASLITAANAACQENFQNYVIYFLARHVH
jgi:hypothetical protein